MVFLNNKISHLSVEGNKISEVDRKYFAKKNNYNQNWILFMFQHSPKNSAYDFNSKLKIQKKSTFSSHFLQLIFNREAA